MGLFDRFKKEKFAAPSASNAEVSSLHLVVQRLKKSQDADVLSALSKVLKTYVDNNTWISIPTIQDAKGQQLQTISSRGGTYAAMYSDASEVRNNKRIVMTDINNLIIPVFHNPEITGIMIDPDTTCLCLDKGFLLKCILHGYLPETHNGGTPQKDWGVGIPQYSQADLMSEGELLNFAMHTVLNHEKMLSSLNPVSACDHPCAVPNLIFEDNGRFVFITVCGYCAEEEPEISEEKRSLLMSYHEKFGASCFYTPVCFRSATDIERFNACLALKGDGFYATYEGLTKVI